MTDRLRVLDLFSGIGGFSLGLERTGGFKTVAFCEIEEFPRRVLAKHWPGVPIYEDIRTLTADRLAADGIAVDVICGGPPCQDLSQAGRRKGLSGRRSRNIFPFLRLVRDLRPAAVIIENVTALRRRGLARILRILMAFGYRVEWHCIPGAYVGSPDIRDRLWIIALAQHSHPNSVGSHPAPVNFHRDAELFDQQECVSGSLVSPLAHALAGLGSTANGSWDPEPGVCRVVDGVSTEVDRIKSLGNAVKPHIPELIGRAILQARAA